MGSNRTLQLLAPINPWDKTYRHDELLVAFGTRTGTALLISSL
jgi:hypothetical protein